MVVIVGFGNPLLDVTVKIINNDLLSKYDLNRDDQKELPASKMKALVQDILNLDPVLSPGGCAQNTLRILQWLLKEPNSTIMFGAVGKDEQGRTLKTLVEAAGVQTKYAELENEPTGTSVALISGAHRSLVAYLGAAQHINVKHLQEHDVENTLKVTDLVYMEGFFLTKRRPVVQYIQELCENDKTIFTFNLSSAYMSEKYPDDVVYFAHKCDILIGNLKEFEALMKAANDKTDVKEYAKKLTQNYSNTKNLKYGKIVIITNGSKTVLCSHSQGLIEEISVPKIDLKEIGDTTGAGDAFAGGFIAGILAGQSPLICLKWGCWIAQQIIKQIGCTIPPYSINLEDIE